MRALTLPLDQKPAQRAGHPFKSLVALPGIEPGF